MKRSLDNLRCDDSVALVALRIGHKYLKNRRVVERIGMKRIVCSRRKWILVEKGIRDQNIKLSGFGVRKLGKLAIHGVYQIIGRGICNRLNIRSVTDVGKNAIPKVTFLVRIREGDINGASGEKFTSIDVLEF